MKLKLKMSMKIFGKDKEMFNFSNYSAKSKCYDNSNALVVGKMKDETASLPNKEFAGLKLKMYLVLVDDSSEYKRAKGVNKNVVAKLLLNKDFAQQKIFETFDK